MSDSYCVAKEPCPKCGSSDNLARYNDGHAHCFTPGCGYYERGDGAEPRQARKLTNSNIIPIGEAHAIPTRKLTKETCEKWGYTISTVAGETVQVANYRDPITYEVVAQKVRWKDKSFKVYGDAKAMTLYGRHLWRDKGRRVIITEGEIDALSCSQVLDHKWQVVSIPNGAQSVKKAISNDLEWLLGFEEVVLCFDMDEPGREAVKEAARLLPPGKVKIVTLPLKDASEMLQADRADELVKALWDAKTYRPDGLVTVMDVWERASRPPENGFPYFMPSLNETTFGRRTGECVALGAGTGIGKTTWITQQIAFDLFELKEPVAVFAFEQAPPETVKRVAGMKDGKQYHVPNAEWTLDELEASLKTIADGPGFYLYDHFGSCDWAIVKERIRFLAHSHGVRIFYLDHLTALAAAEDDERKGLERIMAEVGSLVKELDIWLLFVSHLSTPEGKPHEEGGRVMARHFKGSRAIGYWSHFMFGLERSQQSEDESERRSTTFRVLKDRYTGLSTGQTIPLVYEPSTGRFREGEDQMFDAVEQEENF